MTTQGQDQFFVELYEGERLTLHSRLPLLPLIAEALRPTFGNAVDAADLTIAILPVMDGEDLDGEPAMVNVRRTYGHLAITGHLPDGSHVWEYRTIRQLLGPILQRRAAALNPSVKYWGYCLGGPVLTSVPLARPAPHVEGTVEFHTADVGQARFRVQRAAEDELPDFDLDQLGPDQELIRRLGVVMTAETHALLTRSLPLSDRTEVGGFLSGRAYRARQRPDAHIIRILSVLPAQHSGASGLRFTFTGDSFREMNQAIDQSEGQRLVGWYHTHLFPVAEAMGLSQTDVGLHFRTFQQPWQVAGLINYTNGERVLRFYVRDGEEMSACPQWIESERDGYRTTGAGVGT